MLTFSSSEKFLLRHISTGTTADFSDFAHPERTVRAAIIRRALLASQAAPDGDVLITARGIHIVGAVIDGLLDLSDLSGREFSPLPHVSLRSCEIQSGVNLSNVRIGRVCISQCRLPFLLAKGARINGDLDLSENAPPVGSQGAALFVNLDGCSIDGNLIFSNSELCHSDEAAAQSLTGKSFALSAASAKIAGMIDFEPSFTAIGGVNLAYTRIGADLWLDGARLTSCKAHNEPAALDIRGAFIGGRLSLSRKKELGSTIIVGGLNARDCTIQQGVDIAFGVILGTESINFTRAAVNSTFHVNDCWIQAPLRIDHSNISGAVRILSVNRSAISETVQTFLTEHGIAIELEANNFSVDATSANISSEIEVHETNCKTIVLDQATVRGSISILRVLASALICGGTKCDGSMTVIKSTLSRELRAVNLTLTATFYFRQSSILSGGLNLNGASIGGAVVIDHNFEQAEERNRTFQKTGAGLTMILKEASRYCKNMESTVDGAGFKTIDVTSGIVAGPMGIKLAKIAQGLYVSNIVIISSAEVGIDLTNSVIDRSLAMFNCQIGGETNFRWAIRAKRAILQEIQIAFSSFSCGIECSNFRADSVEVVSCNFDGRVGDRSLHLDEAKISGSVEIKSSRLTGRVSARGATIGGDFVFRTSQILTEYQLALDCTRAKIGGALGVLSNSRLLGALNFRFATIAATLEILNSHVIARWRADWSGDHFPGAAIDGAHASVGGAVTVGRYFWKQRHFFTRCYGSLVFIGTRVGGSLVIDEIQCEPSIVFNEAGALRRGDFGVEASSITVTSEILLGKLGGSLSPTVSLDGGTAATLRYLEHRRLMGGLSRFLGGIHAIGTRGQMERFYLASKCVGHWSISFDGFSYKRIKGAYHIGGEDHYAVPDTAITFIEVVERGTSQLGSDTYSNLARHFKDSNKIGDALEVEVAANRARRKAGGEGILVSPLSWLLETLFGYFLSVGRCARTAAIFFSFGLITTLLLMRADLLGSNHIESQLSDPRVAAGSCSGFWDATLFTLDSGLNVLNLLPDKWAPGTVGIRERCGLSRQPMQFSLPLVGSLSATTYKDFFSTAIWIYGILFLAISLALLYSLRTRFERYR